MKPLLLSRAVNFLSAGWIKYGWWTAGYTSSQHPVIIGGCGRSGTTLLRTMLNAHANLVIGPETGLFCGSRDLEHFSRATRIGVDTLQRWYRRSPCLGEFVDRIIEEHLRRSGKPRWGDKSPCNIRALTHVFHFFPEARVIHMIRDGRDVVCSLRDHPKYKWEDGVRVPTNVCNPWSECVSRWVNDASAGLCWRGDRRYHEIRYEELIELPEAVLRRVLEWLGEPWDPAVLAYFQSHDEQGYDAPNPGIKQPVYQCARDRWRTDLPGRCSAIVGGTWLCNRCELAIRAREE
jgi:hypothetical protein